MAIIIIIIIISIIYFLNKNDVQPLNGPLENYQNTNYEQERINNGSNIENDILDEFSNTVTASDPMMKPYKNIDDNLESDPREFVYKKKKFIKRTPDDVKDLFDIEKMLPQEIEDDWFDVEPLRTTKRIKGNLLHPKYLIGVDTIRSSKKNSTHDIRGDIPTPKICISPWNNSTIEPDNNIRGLC
jgi:hypothetical protein